MSRKIVSREAVFAVADWLRAQGEEPTYQRVIELLGGGSNSTVGPHLAAWKEKNSAPARPVPEIVALRGSILVEAVWCAAREQAQAEIEQAKQDAAAEIDLANRALESSIKINEDLEAQLDSLLQRVESLTTDCAEARLGLRQVEDLKRALNEAEQRADDCRQECDALKQEVARLRGQIDSLKEQGGLLRGLLDPKQRSRVTAKRGRKTVS
jgi:peptidoglycan hydrolase CwlO-like protein